MNAFSFKFLKIFLKQCNKIIYIIYIYLHIVFEPHSMFSSQNDHLAKNNAYFFHYVLLPLPLCL